jgi:hypothetical protein
MWSLIVKHKEQIVIQKDLTDEEASAIPGIGAQWILNAFQYHVGLDINSYGLDEWNNTGKDFIIYIRTEDLERLRDNKLNILGIV